MKKKKKGKSLSAETFFFLHQLRIFPEDYWGPPWGYGEQGNNVIYFKGTGEHV